MTDFAVLIVAAGIGSRAGEGLPKQYRHLNGASVLRQTVEKFLSCPGLSSLRVVIHPDHEALYRQAVIGLDIGEPVIGGATRQESVRNGLKVFADLKDDAFVLIHDAARPFISTQLIEACIRKLETSQAVTLALPVTDTLRRAESNILGAQIQRDGLWSVQTPQGFRYGVISRAHENAQESKRSVYTDDSQLASDCGIDVAIVEGSKENIKLTTEDDFKSMTSKRSLVKTGLGYDVHAFGDASDHIRIGGIDIPHSRKLLGHSDADVALHAITDAIYGTIASGDIGSHFPPSKSEFKNMDSAVFLQDAMAELRQEGGEVLHIDATVICEEPKIGPHRDKIRERIAEICGLTLKSVSVKATTSEGLGFTGRREGIACQALVTVELKA